jgi:MoaA/NifB/PqqE/SkfB family radical SAM enzyme
MNKYLHVHWYVTTRCNSRCSYCDIWRDVKYKSQESTLSNRINLLYQLKKLGFISIDFTGGEPLLYKGLPKLIQRAHKMGFFTSLTTNGTLYSKHAHELLGNVSALSFSLDTADRETHNKIRGIPCYDKVIKSILLARKLGELVMLKTTVSNRHMDEIPPLIKLAEKFGILIELNAEFGYFGNSRLTPSNVKTFYRYWKHPNVIISHAHLQFLKDGGNDFQNPRCPLGKNVIVLAPDDSLYLPCMHYVESQFSLIEHNLEKTLKSEDFKMELLKIGRYYHYCQNCTIPCYFEPMYYTNINKYFVILLASRFGYLIKRFLLRLRLKINT